MDSIRFTEDMIKKENHITRRVYKYKNNALRFFMDPTTIKNWDEVDFSKQIDDDEVENFEKLYNTGVRNISTATIPSVKIYHKNFCIGTAEKYLDGYYCLAKIINRLNLNSRLMISKQISSTVKQIHEEGVVHGDFQIDNTMYNGKLTNLIDFEYADPQIKDNDDIIYEKRILVNELLGSIYPGFKIKKAGGESVNIEEMLERLNAPSCMGEYIESLESVDAAYPHEMLDKLSSCPYDEKKKKFIR